MEYGIFRNGALLVQVKPLDSSELAQVKQTYDYIRLNFILEQYIPISIGDYIVYERTGKKYVINEPPKVVEKPLSYQYECVFQGSLHELSKTRVLLTTVTEKKTYTDYKFALTGNAKTFLEFIVENLNRNATIPYQAGAYIDTEVITVDFVNWNCFEAVVELSILLQFDWYLDGNILNFDKKQQQKGYTFQTGRKVGFTNLTRLRVESERVETVVFGYGAAKNIPPRTGTNLPLTYDSENLTENRLSFVGVDGESKLEKNVWKYGRVESVQEFDEIYPQRIASVTSVGTEREVFDSTLEFNINDYLLPGISPKLHFLSGVLTGLTFPISYDVTTGKITLDYYTDESGSYPNSNALPKVGDTYTLFDLIMPAEYVNEAVQRLQERTQEYIDKQAEVKELYEGVLDEEYVAVNGVELEVGDFVRIVSPVFQLDGVFEIKELQQKITNPNIYSLKFGDLIPRSLFYNLKYTNFIQKNNLYRITNSTYTTTQITNQITTVTGEQLQWLPI